MTGVRLTRVRQRQNQSHDRRYRGITRFSGNAIC